MPNVSASTGTRSSTPWNSAAKSSSGRQPQRREPEAANSQLGEVLGVGAAGQHVGHGAGLGVVRPASAAFIASTRSPSNVVSYERQFGDPLAGHVGTDELVDLALEGGLPARQHPAVEHGLGGRPG